METIESTEKKKGMPPAIRTFLIKGLVFFIAWELLYSFVLAPARIPDRVLTNITGIVTADIVSLFYHHVDTILNLKKVILLIDGAKIIGIADPCNALEIFVLYIAFLFCYPASYKLRLTFTAIGIPVIFVANIVRCCLLVWLNISHKGWVDISHHYIFTTVVYLMVFYLWMLFSQRARTYAA